MPERLRLATCLLIERERQVCKIQNNNEARNKKQITQVHISCSKGIGRMGEAIEGKQKHIDAQLEKADLPVGLDASVNHIPGNVDFQRRLDQNVNNKEVIKYGTEQQAKIAREGAALATGIAGATVVKENRNPVKNPEGVNDFGTLTIKPSGNAVVSEGTKDVPKKNHQQKEERASNFNP